MPHGATVTANRYTVTEIRDAVKAAGRFGVEDRRSLVYFPRDVTREAS